MGSERSRPAPPSSLGASGKRLWSAIYADLEDDWTLDAREVDLLGRACAAADGLTDLEAVLKRDGVTVAARGGVALHPAVAEIRQQRALILRLLGAIELSDPKGGSLSSQRARKAAESRWAGRGEQRANG